MADADGQYKTYQRPTKKGENSQRFVGTKGCILFVRILSMSTTFMRQIEKIRSRWYSSNHVFKMG